MLAKLVIVDRAGTTQDRLQAVFRHSAKCKARQSAFRASGAFGALARMRARSMDSRPDRASKRCIRATLHRNMRITTYCE